MESVTYNGSTETIFREIKSLKGDVEKYAEALRSEIKEIRAYNESLNIRLFGKKEN